MAKSTQPGRTVEIITASLPPDVAEQLRAIVRYRFGTDRRYRSATVVQLIREEHQRLASSGTVEEAQ